ncbi:hypothetical protein GGX14DRAFT_609738 [Mycena pura]|uniref:Uncharacterized protein n=1 Tax=Mycena pura TaxID=153505 RepID=A0AAD6VNJ9_9AGAR|nr:hypothetical protein GGX14DRAFT_609738 [Mycena pura]
MADAAALHDLWFDMILQICMAGVRTILNSPALSTKEPRLLCYSTVRSSGHAPRISPLIATAGIYIILFVLAIATLSRRKTAGRRVLLVATWSMVALATGQIVVVLASCAVSIQISQQILVSSADPNAGPVTLYRCYVIWGRKWTVISVPGILILATLGIGLFLTFTTSAFPSSIGYLMGAVTNIVLMVLTAGRIWWIRGETLHVGLDQIFRRLESGALYCVCVILLAVTAPRHDVPEGTLFYVVVGISSQVINIAPTLTIVRVGLGHNIQDSIEKWARDSRPTSYSKRDLTMGRGEQFPPSSVEVLDIRPEV